MTVPYRTLPTEAFWRPAVADRHPLDIDRVWTPKAPFDRSTMIATAGSCFAQRLGQALRAAGARWLDAEPAPETMPADARRAHNYGVFSFRTGNVYTARQLLQWLRWAEGTSVPDELWRMGNGWVDPFRPSLEPAPHSEPGEVRTARASSLRAIASGLRRTDLFIFTLGLTEAWRNRDSGVEYPSCPGVIAGEFDPDVHAFHNAAFAEIARDLEACLVVLHGFNTAMRMILTVSPVPITATASGDHVLVASTHTKSTLRAVAGDLQKRHAAVDYFPSYELTASHPFRGMFYDPNVRTVSAAGVRHVMAHFLRAMGGADAGRPEAMGRAEDDREPHCDDMLLDFYARVSPDR